MKNIYKHKPIIAALKKHNFIKLAIVCNIINNALLFIVLMMMHSISVALGIVTFIFIITILVYLIKIYRAEYYWEIIKLKRMESERYTFFDKQNFYISKVLDLRGEYKTFYFIITPCTLFQKRKRIDYDVITTYYSMDYSGDTRKREEQLSGEYNVGDLIFSNNLVGFIPKDFVKPDYEDVLNSFVYILQREKLLPISEKEYVDIMNCEEKK